MSHRRGVRVRSGQRAARRAWCTLGVGALAVGVSACGGASSSGQTPPQPAASFVPSTAPVYLEFSTALGSTQWRRAEAIASVFSGDPVIRHDVQSLMGIAGRDIGPQLAPLLGARVGIGVISSPAAGGSAPGPAGAQVIAVAELTPGDDAQAQRIMAGSGAHTTVVDGQTIDTAAHGSYVAAVTDNALVVATDRADLAAALAAHARGGANLAGSARFAKAVGQLPSDTFGEVDLQARWVVDASPTARAEFARLGAVDRLDNEQLVASIASEPNGVRVQGIVVGAPAAASVSFAPATITALPGSTVAYVHSPDLPRQAAALRPALAGVTSPGLASVVDVVSAAELPVLLGLTPGELAEPTTAALVTSLAPTTQPAGAVIWRRVLAGRADAVYSGNGSLAIARIGAGATAAASHDLAAIAKADMPPAVTSVVWINGAQLSTLERALQTPSLGPITAADLGHLANVVGWTTGGAQPTFSWLFETG